MTRPWRIVILGLSLTSSWGNGHATTYRGLVKELCRNGHEVTFLERDVPWYAGANRDMPNPPFGRLHLYHDLAELKARFTLAVAQVDLVIVGSYVPEGVAVCRWVLATARGIKAFYDIDTPVTLAKLARGDEEYLAADLVPLFDLYLSFTGGPLLDRLREAFGAKRTGVLYCSFDPELYAPEVEPTRWDLGYLGTYSPDRQPKLAELLFEPARALSGSSFVVAGPQYPGGIDWPDNVQRIEHIPPHGHRAFYNAQAFTLNVTRADMTAAGWSPSVRLFEAAGCGVPVISDPWDGLDSILRPDEEVLIARTFDDVVRHLTTIGKERRRAIGTAARQRVFTEHSAAARARQLEDYVTACLDERRWRPSAPASSERLKPKTHSLEARDNMSTRDLATALPSKKILVTGGTGFLGSHLCERLLARGDSVFCLDNNSTGSLDNVRHIMANERFRFICRDVVQPLPLKVDEIYNLACPASPAHYQADPIRTTRTCVLGALNVLDLARRCGAKVLQASTSEVYGEPEEHPQRERYWGHVNPIGRRSCYDEGKRCAESLFFDYHRTYGVVIKIARIFNTYGPRMQIDDGRIVSNFIVQALQERPLTVYGDGRQTRSFCYVSDMVEALIRLMDSGDTVTGPVNLGNPHEVPVIELADRVIAMTGTSAPIVFKPLPPDDPSRRRPDIDCARKILRWEPRHPLDQGLAATVEYFRVALAEEAPAAGRYRARAAHAAGSRVNIGPAEALTDRPAALRRPTVLAAGAGRRPR